MELTIDGLSAWHSAGAHHTRVLDRVTVALPAGSFGTVLGPSGSGKTTLLRVVAGLHRDASGSIRLGGDRIDELPPERRGIGLVPQDGALFPHLTVTENIEFGLRRTDRRGRRTAAMLDLLGLRRYADRFPHQLSGGQAQRVAVARALAPAPALVLLDEPFSALDAALRGEVRDGVRAALADTGTTALLVTHDQNEALSLSTRLVVLSDGRIRQAGSPYELYSEPVDVWTGRFLGDANILDGVSDGTVADTPLGPLRHQAVAPGPVTVLVRPEQLRLDPGAAAGIPGTVRSTHYVGHGGIVALDLGRSVTALARITATPMPLPGSRIAVAVDGAVRAYPATAAAP
ncbi:ABC transporter ATP-binding protein [Millisia brevis]|uniref:ABC transporter ATP-binding protein n=1 Tax=Millisia brevis TaxID=264148 RepID=UPI00082A1521|nr:ABC transporter ATP-binding protein [Millisia brevis]